MALKLEKISTYVITPNGGLKAIYDGANDVICEREQVRKRWQEMKAQHIVQGIDQKAFKSLMRFITWVRS